VAACHAMPPGSGSVAASLPPCSQVAGSSYSGQCHDRPQEATGPGLPPGCHTTVCCGLQRTGGPGEMAAPPPPTLTGIFCAAEERDTDFRASVPHFSSGADCAAYMRRRRAERKRTNPLCPQFQHMISMLSSWEQIQTELLGTRERYFSAGVPPAPAVPVAAESARLARADRTAQLTAAVPAAHTQPAEEPRAVAPLNRFAALPDREGGGATQRAGEGEEEEDLCAGVRAGLRARLDDPIHRALDHDAVLSTLRYLFFHMRCGIYVLIKDGQLAMFVPFVNTDYRNNWADHLHLDTGDGTEGESALEPGAVGRYYRRKSRWFRSRGKLIGDPYRWWANGRMICNEHSAQGWGDQFLVQLKHMLLRLVAERGEMLGAGGGGGPIEFFLNKRDHPQLRRDLSEPYSFLFPSSPRHTAAASTQQSVHDGDGGGDGGDGGGDGGDGGDGVSRRRCPGPAGPSARSSYAPIASFYCDPSFADIPFPSAADWEQATRRVFPPHGLPCVRYMSTFPAAVPWEQRVPTAFFRGAATGGGVTTASNQRLHVVYHLRNIIIRTGILNWLRFTYDFEIGSA
jgi:hypothetical protein